MAQQYLELLLLSRFSTFDLVSLILGGVFIGKEVHIRRCYLFTTENNWCGAYNNNNNKIFI